jgi:hypothetical protein
VKDADDEYSDRE